VRCPDTVNRILLRLGPRSSFREGFKQLVILTVPFLYIYTLMLFAVKNPHIYQTYTPVHGMNTRQQNKLHVPSLDFAQCREVSATHLLRYSTTFHKIYLNHNNLHVLKFV
jgi:hypothetical protein